MASAATANRRTGNSVIFIAADESDYDGSDASDSMLLTIEEGFGLARLGYTSDSSQVHPLWPLIARW